MTLRRLFQWTCGTILICCVAIYIAASLRWPLVGDATLIHYVVYLTNHSFVPYKSIIDLNFPLTYAMEGAVMKILGPGALAWRLYDLFLLALIAAALLWSSRSPRERFAALFAASVFAVLHGRDGIPELGQRDLEITALLVVAFAFLEKGFRPPRIGPANLIAAAVCVGAAGAIKPLALLLVPFWIVPAAFVLPSPGRRRLALAGIASAAASLPLVGTFLYLWHIHAVQAFLSVERIVTPLHASMFRFPLGTLITHSLPSVLYPPAAATILMLAVMPRWRDAREQRILLGILFGLISFCAQGRGYPYHRYPEECFFLLLIGLKAIQGMSHTKVAVRAIAYAGLAWTVFVVTPRAVAEIAHFTWTRDPFEQALSAELGTLGRSATDRNVQCLDQAGGCIATLYNAAVTQKTGVMYDCYLFTKTRDAEAAREQQEYREIFRREVLDDPPHYLIVTSDECGLSKPDFDYRKLQVWSDFSSWLRGYRLIDEYRPSSDVRWTAKAVLPYGFRIYALETTKR